MPLLQLKTDNSEPIPNPKNLVHPVHPCSIPHSSYPCASSPLSISVSQNLRNFSLPFASLRDLCESLLQILSILSIHVQFLFSPRQRRLFPSFLFPLSSFLFSINASGQPPTESDLTDLESFVVYEDPKIVDGSRRRPFTRRDPVVEQFFHTLPKIAQSIYLKRLALMEEHMEKLREGKNRKTTELARLAGLERAPRGLIEGYEDRVYFLSSILAWMKRQPPVQVDKLIVWEERAMKLRLKRFQFPHLRLDPDTGELESRIKLNWRLFHEPRPESMDLTLNFDLGINLRTLNGYYNPRGFIQWDKLSPRHLRVLRLEYPIIVAQELRDDPSRGIAACASGFGRAIDSIYQILTDLFFSHLSDLHGLHVLARGSLFADEWGQFHNTLLARGLAAWLSFTTLQDDIGPHRLNEIRRHDWTVWNLRRIGTEFDDLNWENNFQPLMRHGRYKEMPRLDTIFWSTLFVYYLIDQFGPDFPDRMFAQMRRDTTRNGPIRDEKKMFHAVTGQDLEEVIEKFTIGALGRAN